MSTQQPGEACKVDSSLIFQKNKTERDNGELSYCIYPRDPSGHARHSAAKDRTCRVPGGGRPRGAASPVLCAAAAPADLTSGFSFLLMLRCCPRLHARFLPSRPPCDRSRRTLRPSGARAASRSGETSAAPGRDSPPPGFHAARVRKGSSAARETLHVAARPASPPLSGAPPGRRGAAATRRREGRGPGVPSSEPAGSPALVSQASSLPAEGHKARSPRRPTP